MNITPKIELIQISKIKPYWRNPRANLEAVAAVKASIERYGFNQPLVIDQKGVIIVGHTRYKACISMGIAEIPCIKIDLTPEKASEYRIADNKTAELAEWDMTKLIPELRAIADAPAFQIFFGDEDIQKLISLSQSIEDVTNEDIQKHMNAENNRFDKASSRAQSSYITVECSHCGQKITLDATAIEQRRKWTESSNEC